jgi:hypothetical protein
MGRSSAICLALGLIVACASSPTGGAERITLADGSSALTWGSGEYGVVLIAAEGEQPEDWAALASEIAANQMTVVAPDPAASSSDQLAASAVWLTDDDIERVAYVASGESGGALVAELAAVGGAVDQLILISGDLTDAEVAALGELPKLFVAAEDDANGRAAAERLSDAAAGTWNDLLLIPGTEEGARLLDGEAGEELIGAVVMRLEERR